MRDKLIRREKLFESCPRFVHVAPVFFALFGACPFHCAAQSTTDDAFAERRSETTGFFDDRVAPFVKTYCIECHSNRRPTEAGVSFTPILKDPGSSAFHQLWKKSAARVKTHDMPPEYADEQPSDEERQMFGDWLSRLKYLSEKDPGPFIIRRLTKTEYGNTLRDLFGVDPAIAQGLPDDVSGEGYLNSLSPLQLEQYLAIAEKVLEQVLSTEASRPNESHKSVFSKSTLPDDGDRKVARRVAKSLARKAYRRPPSDSEVDVLLDVFDLAIRNDLAARDAMGLMLKAILVSPQFLFITPAEEVDPGIQIATLDDYQLASRMSYLLWATMPDDELMALAEQGKLREPTVLKTQVKRLLDDPRSRALFDGFGAQWLGLGDLQDKTFDPAMFPQMNGELRTAMYDEVRLLFESIVRENQSVVAFVDCDYTFLNEQLATIYGPEFKITGPSMQRVQLTNQNRGGILSMPGILAATSFPNRTSPVKRGVWVLERVLGDQIPPAPPDVPALENRTQGTTANLTLRELTQRHTTDPVCANCHETLDPIGFGLENYDAIGRWRVQDDNGQPIDASGELPGGTRFSGPRDLKATVAARIDKISRSLVEKLLAYSLCRQLEGYDDLVVDDLMHEIASDGYRMQTLITAVVTSYPFTHRRVQE